MGDHYSLKEACDKTGYKASVIRYYEKEFSIDIPRDESGRRYFTMAELDKFNYIKQLQEKGYTNTQIKKMLDNNTTLEETAVSTDCLIPQDTTNQQSNVITFIDQKFRELNDNLSQINQSAVVQERDILLSENMKLKMELKQRAYELIEIKEKLHYEKESKNKHFLSKIFSAKKRK